MKQPRSTNGITRVLRAGMMFAAMTSIISACGGSAEHADMPPDQAMTAGATSDAGPESARSPALKDGAPFIQPPGPVGASVARGRAIMLATRDSLPREVGNTLRCTSCHLDEGRRPDAMPWTGVYARFPQYRSRSGKVIRLEDRVNGCLQRSMNGRPLAYDSDAMRDIIAYMAYLSDGVAVGGTVPGQGMPPLDPLEPDTARGREVFVTRCVACHGADGEGTAAATPLWGPNSYNIGAGMTRLRTAAAFIHQNMPFGDENLTPQQAYDVAAYVNSHPRPDLPGKENDWPNGDAPPDAAYATRAQQSAARPDR